MNVLMLEWDSFGQEYIYQAFKDQGCAVEIYPWPFGAEDMRENPELEKALKEKVKRGGYDFVFSLNFFPVAAKVCFECGVTYVSWVYDTPYLLLYSKHIQYETNIVYLFDKSLYKEFRNRQLNNVYYLPMAAPVEVYDRVKVEKESFCSDISFVGSTYQENRQDFFALIENANPYVKGYLDAIINMQKEVYGSFFLDKVLSEPILRELQNICPIPKGEDEWESDEWLYANYFLARKLTGLQRMEILQMLSENHRLSVYTPENVKELGIWSKGPVDYISEMPQIFKGSKINLNMTLRSIQSGIPLRAMDIMGCGGFLLTNYQADFEEYFEAGVDYVYYTDNEDLLYKVDYYLEHEEERKQIALNGYHKVQANHTYKHRVQTILQMVRNR
ncbi:MAG: glycosyltransferase [Lachnospiraceae bacterium]|nr:glycosyltransferase [Lachnospiraceae bacterium]